MVEVPEQQLQPNHATKRNLPVGHITRRGKDHRSKSYFEPVFLITWLE
jgi:hypothetical protein